MTKASRALEQAAELAIRTLLMGAEQHDEDNTVSPAAIRRIAESAGYYVREGSYYNTTDDRIGRWYVGHGTFYPRAPGYPSEAAAWQAAYDRALDDAAVASEWPTD